MDLIGPLLKLIAKISLSCREEADEYISIGALNGLFVLGRSIGFIGKYLHSILFGIFKCVSIRIDNCLQYCAV